MRDLISLGRRAGAGLREQNRKPIINRGCDFFEFKTVTLKEIRVAWLRDWTIDIAGTLLVKLQLSPDQRCFLEKYEKWKCPGWGLGWALLKFAKEAINKELYPPGARNYPPQGGN